MKYTETIPSENFSELVYNYWKFEISTDHNDGKPFLFEVMPENTRSIVFISHPHYSTITCLNPLLRRMKREVFPGSVYLGIRFHPWVSIEGLFEGAMTSSNQNSNPINHLNKIFSDFSLAKKSSDSECRQIEKGLAKLSNHFKITSDPLIKYICLQLEDGRKINDLIKDIPLSIRPVQKQFKKITGMTMTEFRNINKLRTTVKLIYSRQKNITHAAFENGYTDHAHFMNTFKKFMMGSSLKQFLAQTELISHQIPD